MNIYINEQITTVAEGVSIRELADSHKPGADVLILNGFPTSPEIKLQEGDEVFLISRGEIPTNMELEALMAARHTPGVHAKLKAATVGIAGVGGLGSAVAVALARVGIGRLIIADFDVVEPSNLNRQQYFIDQIGMHKVVALAANLHRINPYVSVVQHTVLLDPQNISTTFSGCSIIIEAFDRADMKAMLVNTVLEQMAGVIIIAASGLAGHGSNNTIKTSKISEHLYLIGDGVSEAQPGNGLLAPRVGIAASHQANQAVRCILGENFS